MVWRGRAAGLKGFCAIEGECRVEVPWLGKPCIKSALVFARAALMLLDFRRLEAILCIGEWVLVVRAN